MTLSDAASLVSIGVGTHVSDVTPADSWAIGLGIDGGTTNSWASLTTPPTPALVAVSPGATPSMPTPYHHHAIDPTDAFVMSRSHGNEDCDQSGEHFKYMLQERRRKWAQEKLAHAVYSHPRSLRSFCLAAYKAADDIRNQQATAKARVDPETWIEPAEPIKVRSKMMDRKQRFLHEAVDFIFNNVPLSVFLDAVDSIGSIALDTTFACFTLVGASVNGIMSALVHFIHLVWDTATSIVSNPFKLLEMIISLQFNAMGKTSEVLVSGIQSVATGVESASSIALHKLSAANLSTKGGSASSMGLDRSGNIRRGRGSLNNELNRKLLRKMSSINDAARVVRYTETKDDTGGLTRHAISRTRRMMHYSVSLRPFVATVTVNPSEELTALLTSSPDHSPERLQLIKNKSDDDGSRSSEDAHGSPVICSPQSFPPTPHSRQMVLARGSQFADDVVFLARDRLRIHDGLESENERTREMAQALKEGKRLAIFDGNGAHGIELTCGQHIATKVGNMHYASTRSMVPVLRNCYVYFEITIMPRSPLDHLAQQAPLTLAVGVSTVEMPPNTLVGAWQGSVGLCTTGQIFVAGQWCSPHDPSMGADSYGATVGCLVFLDDSSAFETWDGVMVNAYVTFNINGLLVPPPSSAMAIPGIAAQQNNNHKQYRHVSQSPSFSNSSPSALASSPPLTTAAQPNWRIAVPKTTTQTLLVPASEELYPTVTLQTPSTAVMCRFSAEDMLSSSTRESIGVPPNAIVYSVDGTMLFAVA
ncbi:hypothetical protein MPSEU_000515500 [Mayamaea pseudoterrestris]|nr:hypothetical protein MPSEU_000515500 [Mayamaea pseudoterrestris]